MPASRRTVLAVLAAAAVGVLAARRFVTRVAGPEDEAAGAARYAHMIGEDLPREVLLEQARRLAVGAPIRRVHRRLDGGLYLEVSP